MVKIRDSDMVRLEIQASGSLERGTWSRSLLLFKWHGGSSICDKCECGEAQDEKHVLFFASVLKCASCA